MTRAPHIALIRQRYTPFGGAERFIERAMAALVAEGTRLTTIARDWPRQDGVETLHCNPFYVGRRWRDRAFARCVCRVLETQHFDLVQSHERIPCCDLYRAGDGVHREWLRQRARALGSVGWLLQALSPYHRNVKQAEVRLFTSPQLKAVICNSEMVKQEIVQHFGFPAERIHVIYNGVDASRFHPGLRDRYRHSVRAEHDIPAHVSLLLFVGSGFQRKGLGPLLFAMASLSTDVHLLVVGKDRSMARYQRLARRLGLGARVRLLGPRPDVTPYYGAADVLVLPTLYDPFPNVVLEAMASGLPVITGSKSGAVDLIRNGETGFICDPLRGNQLLEAIRGALEPDVRRAMGERARERILPLTTERMTAELVALYHRLLQQPRP